MEVIEITIKDCKLCQKSHKHFLRIGREHVFGLITPDAMKERTKMTDVFLTCPEKDAPFKATIALRETSLDRIESVTEVKTDGKE